MGPPMSDGERARPGVYSSSVSSCRAGDSAMLLFRYRDSLSVRETIASTEASISGNTHATSSPSEYETRKGGLFLHRPRPHAKGVRQR